ncbi:MAG: hypothetical protein ACTSPY_17520 [Candidatus Helarchaeota archaeon]
MAKRWKVIIETLDNKIKSNWTIDFVEADQFIGNQILSKNYMQKLFQMVNNYSNYHWQCCIKKIVSSNNQDYTKKAIGVILVSLKYYDHKYGLLFGELNSGDFKIIALWEQAPEKYSIKNERNYVNIINRLLNTPNYFKDIGVVFKIK